MNAIPPHGFEWPAPWEPIPDEDTWFGYPRITAEAFGDEPPVDTLAQELQREVSPAHPLYRVTCTAVGRNRADPNEFLFLTDRPGMPLAFVHLTWAKEKGAKFPWVEGYESWEAFRLAWAGASGDGQRPAGPCR
jgi:hypothetical protein